METKQNRKKHYYFVKEKAKQAAIFWQCKFNESKSSYRSAVEMQNHFYKLGKKYGLIKEFKENGII